MAGHDRAFPPTDEEARERYHRTLPGGLPRDWLNYALRHWDEDPWTAMCYSLMAFLGVCGSLHVDQDGRPADYRACELCITRPSLESTGGEGGT